MSANSKRAIARAVFGAVAGGSLLLAGIPVSSAAPAHQNAGPFKIGVSNSFYTNTWRQEMLCSISLEAQTPETSPLINGDIKVANAGQDVARQIADIRNFVTEGYDMILIDPASTQGYDQVLQEATDAGVKVLVFDQFVPSDVPWQVANDQQEYGRQSMRWLANAMGGKGDIGVIRGIIGTPGDADREAGLEEVLQQYPDIHIVANPEGQWDETKAHDAMASILAAHPNISGVWASGGDTGVAQAFIDAGHPWVPIAGEEDNGFARIIIQNASKGLKGTTVSNPPAVGAYALLVGLQILQGADIPKKSTMTPRLMDNQTGLADLQSNFAPDLPDSFQVNWGIPNQPLGQTHYSFDAMKSCMKAAGTTS